MEKMQDGVVRVRAASALPPLADLAFARDLMVVCAELPALNAKDRVSPLAASLDAAALLGAPEVLAPDAEATKPLAPLLTALAARLATRPGVRPVFEHQTDHLAPVIWMLSGTHALVGHAPAHGGAVFAGGIPRLKFPREAPSRSTLTLEVAFHVLMQSRNAKLLRAGATPSIWAPPGQLDLQLVARQIPNRHRQQSDGWAPAASSLVEHLRRWLRF
jgi:23S rRNA (cytidine2498-2'-O)-methyltransferase